MLNILKPQSLSRKQYYFFKILMSFSIYSLLSVICSAQWQPDVRLTNNPAESYTSLNNAWCVTAAGSVVHVVWYDNRDGNYEIYYKRSTNGGVNWSADVRLSYDTGYSNDPSVAVSGQVVHVVWWDNTVGNFEIRYKRSTDGGVNWSNDIPLSNNLYASRHPCITLAGQLVHVVWDDNRDGNYEIYYKRSSDGGVNWGIDTRLTNSLGHSMLPSVAVTGSFGHVVWHDDRDGNYEIYYKRSTDSGLTWEADVQLTNDTARSLYPCIAAFGSFVHVVWNDTRNGSNFKLYYKHSTDGGLNWGIDTAIFTNYNSETPSITVSDQLVHVVWDITSQIFYKRSTNGGITWETETQLTSAAASRFQPSVAVSGQFVHIIWQDYRDGNPEIYYKRNPTGNPFGIKNINTDVPKEFNLYQNYPNPFNPTTKIKFDLPTFMKGGQGGLVTLKIYDILGREIVTLVNEQLKPGTYEVEWEAANYPSGIYLYRLLSDDYINTKKMMLVK